MFTNPEPYCKITFHGTGTLLNKAVKILDQFKECPFITWLHVECDILPASLRSLTTLAHNILYHHEPGL